jgi:hypothetical protein
MGFKRGRCDAQSGRRVGTRSDRTRPPSPTTGPGPPPSAGTTAPGPHDRTRPPAPTMTAPGPLRPHDRTRPPPARPHPATRAPTIAPGPHPHDLTRAPKTAPGHGPREGPGTVVGARCQPKGGDGLTLGVGRPGAVVGPGFGGRPGTHTPGQGRTADDWWYTSRITGCCWAL